MDILDLENPVIRLCIESTQAEFVGQLDNAREISWQAWQAVTNDYEACIAAHYVAHFQTSPEAVFHWDRLALQYADACMREQVAAFYPSLYVNMGHSYEQLGNHAEAERYYALAAELGLCHQK